MHRLGLWLVMGLMVAGGARAEVEVVGEAAWRGQFGLRADVAQECPEEETILVLGPIVTVQRVQACKEVFVGEAHVEEGGRLEAIGGERVVLGSGFSVAEGGELVVGTDGTWQPGYVVEGTPAGEPRLFVRSYVRLDGVVLGPGGTLTMLGVGDGTRRRGRVRYEVGEGGGWVWVEVLEDDGSEVASARGWIASGWHRIELEWKTGPAITAGGVVVLGIDDSEVARLEGLNLGLGLVEEVEVGAWDASAGEGGWVDFDEVAAGRAGPLGGVE